MEMREQQTHGNGSSHPAGNPPGPAASADDWDEPQVELRHYLRILVRRHRVILLALVTVVATAAFQVFTTAPVYRATAKVRVQQPPPSPLTVLLGDSNRREDVSPLETQAKVVQSSILAEQTAKLLAAEGCQGVSAGEVMGSLHVAVEKPDVIAISVEHTDPDRAMVIANAVQQTYIEEDKANARAEASSILHFLEKQLPEAESELRAAEAAVKRYKARHNIQDFDSISQMKARAAFEYGEQAAQAQAEWRAAEAELSSLRARLAAEPPLRVGKRVVNDPVAEAFRQEMASAEVALAKARGQYEDTHLQVQALRDKLSELRLQFTQRYGEKRSSFRLEDVEEPNPNYELLRARIPEQESQVAALKTRAETTSNLAGERQRQLPNMPGDYAELAHLEHEMELKERSYLSLLGQFQQAQLGAAREFGAARVLDVARRPGSPVRPQRQRTMALAAVVGLMVGVGLALLVEHADTSVGTPDELVQQTGLNCLGFIPSARSQEITTIAIDSPRSPISEGFRSIRSNLRFSYVDDPLHTLAVTSAGAGEGKSFTSANLAIVFAQTDLRVILVDADLRRPSVHRMFGRGRRPGLTDVLAGDVDLDDALQATAVPGLQLLTSGTTPPNPSELLESRRMLELIDTLKGRADVVIFDTPPALVVTDAIVLSSRVDGLVVVAEQGRVSYHALIEVSRLVAQARGRIAGAVLNKVKAAPGDSYYYYYYRHGYYYGDGKGRGWRRSRSLPDPAQEPTASVGSADDEA